MFRHTHIVDVRLIQLACPCKIMQDNRLVLNSKFSYSVLSFILVDRIGLCQNYRHFMGMFPISVCNDPKDGPMGLYITISVHIRISVSCNSLKTWRLSSRDKTCRVTDGSVKTIGISTCVGIQRRDGQSQHSTAKNDVIAVGFSPII